MRTTLEKRPALKFSPDRVRFDNALAKVGEHFQRARRAFANCHTDDDRLIRLWKLTNEVADCALLVAYAEKEFQERNRVNLHFCLGEAAGFMSVWLHSQAEAAAEVIEVIWKERVRQVSLRLANPRKYSFAMEHPLPDPRRKFRVLAEEVGEVADAIDKIESATSHSRATARYHLDVELIQTTAVLYAWLESFEVQS